MLGNKHAFSECYVCHGAACIALHCSNIYITNDSDNDKYILKQWKAIHAAPWSVWSDACNVH